MESDRLEGGVFTHHFLAGLVGAADTSGEGGCVVAVAAAPVAAVKVQTPAPAPAPVVAEELAPVPAPAPAVVDSAPLPDVSEVSAQAE